MAVQLAFYADDFTGATDVLLQARRCGLDGPLLLRPDPQLIARHADNQVVGVAGTARSLPTGELEAEVGPALAALAALKPRVLQYKACSTVDSSPELGSIGWAVEAGAALLGQGLVPLLFAQPDFGRYTIFGTHFAAQGDEVFRLDRHPTMSRHPSTPIDEAYLPEFLGRQTRLPVSSWPRPRYGQGAPSDRGAVVLDALDDEDLRDAGSLVLALAEPTVFAVGSGGLSRAVGLNLGRQEETTSTPSRHGSVLVLAGSQSPLTAAQLADATAAGWPSRALTAADLADPTPLAHWVDQQLAAQRRAVLHTRDLVVPALDDIVGLFGALWRKARTGVDPLVILCGGDTSSRLVRGSGADTLAIESVLAGNVPISRLSGGTWADGARVLLKGGQVGPVDLFSLTFDPEPTTKS